MKKVLLVLLLSVAGMLATTTRVQAQSAEITQLLLDIEKLATLKNILSDMKKGYEILTNGYNTVKNISQGNFSLHQLFLDGLLVVNPDIASYSHVSDIISDEAQILRDYKSSMSYFKASGGFSLQEIDQMAGSFDAVVKDAGRVLDELTLLVTSSKLRMSDDERLAGIDRLYGDIEKQVGFVRGYTDQLKLLTIQRIQSGEDLRMMQRLHGLN